MVDFARGARYVLVADKVGDVYVFDLDDDRYESDLDTNYICTQPAYLDAKAPREPAMGHFSLITDLAVSPDSKIVATADREGHVRISRFPQLYDIVTVICGCGGNEKVANSGDYVTRIQWDTTSRRLRCAGTGMWFEALIVEPIDPFGANHHLKPVAKIVDCDSMNCVAPLYSDERTLDDSCRWVSVSIDTRLPITLCVSSDDRHRFQLRAISNRTTNGASRNIVALTNKPQRDWVSRYATAMSSLRARFSASRAPQSDIMNHHWLIIGLAGIPSNKSADLHDAKECIVRPALLVLLVQQGSQSLSESTDASESAAVNETQQFQTALNEALENCIQQVLSSPSEVDRAEEIRSVRYRARDHAPSSWLPYLTQTERTEQEGEHSEHFSCENGDPVEQEPFPDTRRLPLPDSGARGCRLAR